MVDFLSEGFICEYLPGRLVVGSGPVERRDARIPNRPACYAPDFFLDDPHPWLHPADWRELTRDELRASLPAPVIAPRVTWVPPDRDTYARVFADLADAIARGPLAKAVPLVVERGRFGDGISPVPAFLAALLDAPDSSLIYGWWRGADGIIGASPELLFRRLHADRVETAAIAGTYPSERGARLADDPKEVAEHRSVVDDITAALAPLGRVERAARELLCLPHVTHLKTDLVLAPDRALAFDDLVRALHPTAALGVAPRDAGGDLLRRLDAGIARGRLGAPFGVEWPDGRAACLVAIRNVQWRGANVALGAGGGIIAQSRLEAEWEELRLKRESVKRMLGI